MTSARFTLHGGKERRLVADLAATADPLTRVTFAEPKRSDAQNDRMWAMIEDIMRQRPAWFDQTIDKEGVKQVMMGGLFRDLHMVRNADNDGYMPLAYRSSTLSSRQMGELLDYIDAWGSRNGVQWSDPAILRDNPRSTVETREGVG